MYWVGNIPPQYVFRKGMGQGYSQIEIWQEKNRVSQIRVWASRKLVEFLYTSLWKSVLLKNPPSTSEKRP